MSDLRQHDIEMRGLRHQLEQEIAKLIADRDKWHRVAMDAGAVTCVGGSHMFPLKDEIASLRAQLAAFKAAAIDFIAKVDRGEARSRRSYAAFKAALSLSDEKGEQ